MGLALHYPLVEVIENIQRDPVAKISSGKISSGKISFGKIGLVTICAAADISAVAKIAALLGISVDTAGEQVERARRDIGRPGNSVAIERAS